MAAFLLYIIRWAITFTLLYSLYGLFLRRETFHAVNRCVLLSILISSMILPLCTIETSEPTLISKSVNQTEAMLSASVKTAELVASDSFHSPFIQQEENLPMIYAIWTIATVYLIGLLYFWLRYFVAIVTVVRFITSAQPFQIDNMPRGTKLLSHAKVKVPCSWFRWVLVNPIDENNDIILAHELAHVRLLHSLDMLIAETSVNMLWFLPFSWMLRKDLKDIHEYQADCSVLRQGHNRDQYELLLIDRVSAAQPMPVINSLNQSNVKKRLKMLYTKPSSRLAMMKVFYLLPLMAIALTAFARPTMIQEVKGNLYRAEAEAYKIVKKAPSFIPEGDTLVVYSVPACPFSLRKEVAESGVAHHLFTIDEGTREMWSDWVELCRGFNFRHVNGETYMNIFGTIDSDSELIWLGGPDTYIVNETTGVRYKARRALPPGDLNRYILVKGCKGQEFMYTIVFPDLPTGWWHGCFYGIPYCQLRGGVPIANVSQYFEN